MSEGVGAILIVVLAIAAGLALAVGILTVAEIICQLGDWLERWWWGKEER